MPDGGSSTELQELTRRLKAEAESVGEIQELTLLADAHRGFTCRVRLRTGAQRTKFVAHFGGIAVGKTVYFSIPATSAATSAQ